MREQFSVTRGGVKYTLVVQTQTVEAHAALSARKDYRDIVAQKLQDTAAGLDSFLETKKDYIIPACPTCGSRGFAPKVGKTVTGTVSQGCERCVQ